MHTCQIQRPLCPLPAVVENHRSWRDPAALDRTFHGLFVQTQSLTQRRCLYDGSGRPERVGVQRHRLIVGDVFDT